MREIKFRAWNPHEKIMDFDELIPAQEVWFDEGTILMQYTGLKDKNGREIYEGDVVEVVGHAWRDDWGGIEEVVSWREDGHFFPFGDDDYAFTGENVKVIGNIYENPELLK